MESACVFSFGLLVLQADSISAKLFTRVNAFMLIYFLTFNIYKHAFPLFLIYSFDNDDMKSSKRRFIIVNFLAEMFLINGIAETFSWSRLTNTFIGLLSL